MFAMSLFQSTRLRETRLDVLSENSLHHRFNPRAYVRRDGGTS